MIIILDKNKYLEYLKTQKLSNETGRVYYYRIKKYLRERNISGDKKYISQMKMAVKYYYKMQDIYFNDDVRRLTKIYKKSKKSIPKKEEILKLKLINQKINLMTDIRKKLAFRLQLISGLRIGEISNLNKSNIQFDKNYRLIVTVIQGKGNKDRTIKTLPDKFVWSMLQKLSDRKGKLFYSKITLQKEAQKIGFKTHKLRKVFADQIYYKVVHPDKIKLLQQLLGHEPKSKTWKKYVNNNFIDTTGTKFDI